MARVKGGLNAKKKHNRVLKMAKGYRGARSKQYRIAKQSVMRALTSSYAGRKERKRQFRLRFRGREMAHMFKSKYILDDFAESLKDIAVIDKPSKVEGRSMVMFLTAKR